MLIGGLCGRRRDCLVFGVLVPAAGKFRYSSGSFQGLFLGN